MGVGHVDWHRYTAQQWRRKAHEHDDRAGGLRARSGNSAGGSTGESNSLCTALACHGGQFQPPHAAAVGAPCGGQGGFHGYYATSAAAGVFVVVLTIFVVAVVQLVVQLVAVVVVVVVLAVVFVSTVYIVAVTLVACSQWCWSAARPAAPQCRSGTPAEAPALSSLDALQPRQLVVYRADEYEDAHAALDQFELDHG